MNPHSLNLWCWRLTAFHSQQQQVRRNTKKIKLLNGWSSSLPKATLTNCPHLREHLRILGLHQLRIPQPEWDNVDGWGALPFPWLAQQGDIIIQGQVLQSLEEE